MYDVDHIPDPRGYYDEKVRGREAELGIVLAHVTPSTEGLRLLFVIPRAGMAPDEAQRWMSARLGDAAYDGAVKDLARCSFLVPREYVLYLDEERLFGNEELRMKNGLRMVKILHSEAKPTFFILHYQSLRGCPIRKLSDNGSSWQVANPCPVSVTTSSTAWPRTCATLPTTTRR